MQIEITEAISAFFAGHLSRKPTQAELQKLHDEFSADFEGMVDHANKIGITYKSLLINALVDKYGEEIYAEAEAFQLRLAFTTASSAALEALTKLKDITKEILESDSTVSIVDQLDGDLNMVTVREPLILKLYLDDVLKACEDASLKEMVLRKDPLLSLADEEGLKWYDTVIKEGRVTVDSIKRVRKLFNPDLVSIKEGKRIVELVRDGHIRK